MKNIIEQLRKCILFLYTAEKATSFKKYFWLFETGLETCLAFILHYRPSWVQLLASLLPLPPKCWCNMCNHVPDEALTTLLLDSLLHTLSVLYLYLNTLLILLGG